MNKKSSFIDNNPRNNKRPKKYTPPRDKGPKMYNIMTNTFQNKLWDKYYIYLPILKCSVSTPSEFFSKYFDLVYRYSQPLLPDSSIQSIKIDEYDIWGIEERFKLISFGRNWKKYGYDNQSLLSLKKNLYTYYSDSQILDIIHSFQTSNNSFDISYTSDTLVDIFIFLCDFLYIKYKNTQMFKSVSKKECIDDQLFLLLCYLSITPNELQSKKFALEDFERLTQRTQSVTQSMQYLVDRKKLMLSTIIEIGEKFVDDSYSAYLVLMAKRLYNYEYYQLNYAIRGIDNPNIMSVYDLVGIIKYDTHDFHYWDYYISVVTLLFNEKQYQKVINICETIIASDYKNKQSDLLYPMSINIHHVKNQAIIFMIQARAMLNQKSIASKFATLFVNEKYATFELETEYTSCTLYFKKYEYLLSSLAHFCIKNKKYYLFDILISKSNIIIYESDIMSIILLKYPIQFINGKIRYVSNVNNLGHNDTLGTIKIIQKMHKKINRPCKSFTDILSGYINIKTITGSVGEKGDIGITGSPCQLLPTNILELKCNDTDLYNQMTIKLFNISQKLNIIEPQLVKLTHYGVYKLFIQYLNDLQDMITTKTYKSIKTYEINYYYDFLQFYLLFKTCEWLNYDLAELNFLKNKYVEKLKLGMNNGCFYTFYACGLYCVEKGQYTNNLKEYDDIKITTLLHLYNFSRQCDDGVINKLSNFEIFRLKNNTNISTSIKALNESLGGIVLTSGIMDYCLKYHKGEIEDSNKETLEKCKQILIDNVHKNNFTRTSYLLETLQLFKHINIHTLYTLVYKIYAKPDAYIGFDQINDFTKLLINQYLEE